MIICLDTTWFRTQAELEYYIAYVVEPALPAAGESIELENGSMY